MSRTIGFAVAVLLASSASALEAQKCVYGPNTQSPFAKPSGEMVSFGGSQPLEGTLGFHYEFRGVVMIVGVRPFSYAVIGCIIPGSPAAEAGLQSEDVIVSVNGKDSRQRGASTNGTSSALRLPCASGATARSGR